MRAVFQILFGAALALGSAVALGLLLLYALRIRLRRMEHELVAFLTGSALLSLLVFLMGMVHLLRRGVIQVAGIAIIAAGVWAWRRNRPAGAFEPLPRAWRYLFWGGYAIYGVLYFFNALAPEVSPDGSSYHLEFVGEYLRQHALVPIPTNMYASLSQGLEMLFVFAFAVGRHSAAALVHCGFLLALPLSILCFGRRFGHPKAGAFAALLAYACPLMGIDGISAYNDVALAATAFGLFYLLELWDREGDSRLLPLAGLLAGFCYALKYTGALAIPYAVGFVAWRLFRAKRPWFKAAAVVGAVAAVSVFPWMLKNWVWMGNPLAPFYNAWFPNPNFHIMFENQYREGFRHLRDGSSRWWGLVDVTAIGQLSEGLIGPVFLLTPLALLSLRSRLGRSALAMALVFLPAYLSNYGGRFLLPLLPFVSLALGLALSAPRGVLQVVLALHLIASWPRVLEIYATRVPWRLRSVPFGAALRIRPEEDFLTSRMPDYLAARMLDDFTPKDAKIFMTDGVPQSYTTRKVIVGYTSGFGRTLIEILWCPMQSWMQQLQDYRYRFPAQPLRGLRMVEIGPRVADAEWRITEFRIRSNGQDLPRRPAWRLRADPNPWDVQLAFDNSYVTPWVSREPFKPGMKVEVDFGGMETVDEVTLEAQDGLWVVLRLEGLDAGGQWKPIDAKYEKTPGKPLHGLRRAAAEEFKARGVNYIMVKPGDVGAMDFAQNAEIWGFTELGERNGTRLYRIE